MDGRIIITRPRHLNLLCRQISHRRLRWSQFRLKEIIHQRICLSFRLIQQTQKNPLQEKIMELSYESYGLINLRSRSISWLSWCLKSYWNLRINLRFHCLIKRIRKKRLRNLDVRIQLNQRCLIKETRFHQCLNQRFNQQNWCLKQENRLIIRRIIKLRIKS